MIRSICDLSDDHPGLTQTADPLFRDYGAQRVFHGPIATLRCHEDNLLLRRTLSTPGEGRVMVVDGGGSLRRALVGDQLGALLLQHGWAGIIVNGAARDVETLRNMPVAVRAIAACPTRPGQLGTGELGVVLEFAGVVFRPGEWRDAARVNRRRSGQSQRVRLVDSTGRGELCTNGVPTCRKPTIPSSSARPSARFTPGS